MIRRHKVVGLAALLSLGLVGCTSRTETIYVPQTTEATTTTTTLPKPVPTTYGDYWASDYDMFLSSVYSLYGSRIYVSDSDMIDTGDAVCLALWTGSSAEDVINTLAASAVDEDGIAFLSAIVTAAVMHLCPDQMYKFSNLS